MYEYLWPTVKLHCFLHSLLNIINTYCGRNLCLFPLMLVGISQWFMRECCMGGRCSSRNRLVNRETRWHPPCIWFCYGRLYSCKKTVLTDVCKNRYNCKQKFKELAVPFRYVYIHFCIAYVQYSLENKPIY